MQIEYPGTLVQTEGALQQIRPLVLAEID